MREEIIKVVFDKENDGVNVEVQSNNIVDVVMAWGLAADTLKEMLAKHYIDEKGIHKHRAYKEACNFLGCAFEYSMNINKNNPKAAKNSKEDVFDGDREEYIRELKRRKVMYRDLYLDSGDEDYMDKMKSCDRLLQKLLKANNKGQIK